MSLHFCAVLCVNKHMASMPSHDVITGMLKIVTVHCKVTILYLQELPVEDALQWLQTLGGGQSVITPGLASS